MDKIHFTTAHEIFNSRGYPPVRVSVMPYNRTGHEAPCGGGTFEGGHK
jgi:enolase